jgi:hypothetical protein
VSHSYVQNIVHLVFSTKERRKLIPTEFQPALWAYVAGICKKNEIFVHAPSPLPLLHGVAESDAIIVC